MSKLNPMNQGVVLDTGDLVQTDSQLRADIEEHIIASIATERSIKFNELSSLAKRYSWLLLEQVQLLRSEAVQLTQPSSTKRED